MRPATFICLLCTFTVARCSIANNRIADVALPSGDNDNLLVQLSNGKLLGKDNDFYYSYESIPYAAPPLGKLRFEAPRPYAMQWEDVFDARVAPPMCIQWDQQLFGADKLTGQEDCLTVSVYKPKRKADEHGGALPVVVVIHGGAFMWGSVHPYGHESLMRTGQVIVAKIAYRLGPLGFLSTEDAHIAGNFGLKDQRLALQWLKQNIGHFGGDPARIITVGFSAGGASVHLQMLHKDQVAKAAVSFSGTALDPWVFTHAGTARLRAFELGKTVGCSEIESSVELKECLKGKSADSIVRSVEKFLVFGYNPFTTFGPVVEDDSVTDAFIKQPVVTVIRSGNVAQVPWLTTYTAQDGGYNAAELMQVTPEGTELIEIFNDRWLELAPQALFFEEPKSEAALLRAKSLKQEYLGDKSFSRSTYSDVQRMYTDILFKNGCEEAVRLHKNIPGGAPVYAYRYENAGDLGYAHLLANRTDFKEFGSVHGDDVLLIFPSPIRNAELRPDEEINSRKLIDMLLSFVKHGDLKFGTSKLVDNVGQEELQLMCIKGTRGENKSFAKFP